MSLRFSPSSHTIQRPMRVEYHHQLKQDKTTLISIVTEFRLMSYYLLNLILHGILMTFVNTVLNVHINALVEIDIHVAIQRIYYMKISCMGEKNKKRQRCKMYFTMVTPNSKVFRSKIAIVSLQNHYCFSPKSLLILLYVKEHSHATKH